jgi:hypothetical protein
LHLENRRAELSILLNEANAGAMQLETVYFANHESKSGGKISDDARCDEQTLRLEEVWFDAPMPGRYRVGVDHPEQCTGTEEAAAYVVSVMQEVGHGANGDGNGPAAAEFVLKSRDFALAAVN